MSGLCFKKQQYFGRRKKTLSRSSALTARGSSAESDAKGSGCGPRENAAGAGQGNAHLVQVQPR